MTNQEAFAAGEDCVKNGANKKNCHFSIFATPELTKAWEAGKKDAEEIYLANKEAKEEALINGHF